MRFNVDRICELAGLRAASGGLLSEAAVPAPAKPAAAPAAKAPAAPVKAAAAPAKPAAPAPKMEEDDMEHMEEDAYEGYHMEGDVEEDYQMEMGMSHLDDDAMYEIDETELMEALVGMRQQRLEESAVRDAVRDEIRRALSDKSGSWVYGGNKPTASSVGQVSRGGFGVGFRR
jgi:hypothetical protein